LLIVLLCRLRALLSLPPALLLPLLFIVLRVSRDDQSRKQSDYCGTRYTCEPHCNKLLSRYDAGT
jgi:hypothetical protein